MADDLVPADHRYLTVKPSVAPASVTASTPVAGVEGGVLSGDSADGNSFDINAYVAGQAKADLAGGPESAEPFDINKFVQSKKPEVKAFADKPLDERLKPLQKLFAGRDPSVDYETGAPWGTQLALARADNPDEAAAALERRSGPGNYGQDEKGNWWVIQDGKKVAVRPSGGLKAGANNAMVGLTASSPMAAGAIGGGMAGAGGGPFGMVVGAGLGAMAGKTADEGEKAFEGTYRKDVKGEVKTLATEGALNMAMAGAGPLAKNVIAEPFKKAAHWVAETTPTTRAKTAKLVAEGARPPIISAAPGLKPTQYRQKMRNIIMGDPTEKSNTAYVFQRAKDVLTSEGMPPAQIESIMEEVLSKDARMSGSVEGQGLAQAAEQHYQNLQAEGQAATQEARAVLDQAENDLREYAGGQSGRLGEDVERAIAANRSQFGQRMSQVYGSIDAMAGNEPMIPMSFYQNQASLIRSITPPSDLPPIVNDIANSELHFITFQQAHDIRTVLRDIARSKYTNLTPTAKAHRALGRADRADDALEGLADLADELDMAGVAHEFGASAAAVRALREADRTYAEGIRRYRGATVNRLVKDARDGDFVNPEEVARAILKPGHIEEARTIISMLPQPVRDQVARADAFNVIEAATDSHGMLDGQMLRNILRKRAGVMSLVYPPQVLARVQMLADELAALNGQMDVRTIQNFSSENMQRALTTAVEQTRAAQAFVDRNVLRALIDADPAVVDRAADTILSGGKELNLATVRDFLGEESFQWQAIKTYAIKKVLRQAIVETPTLSKNVEGKAIDDALKTWTPAEQDLLFPDGLKEDLQALAKDAKFLFPEDMNDMGASLAGATIKSGFPLKIHAVVKYGEYGILGWISNHPTLLRFLADASRENSSMARHLMFELSRWAANTADTGPGLGVPTENYPAAMP